jgi:hypothetical protein
MDEYAEYVERAKQMILQKSSQPRRKTQFTRFLEPGDKGFVENRKDYPWSLEGYFAGIPKNVSIDLLGFVINDRRTTPHVMIFRNQKAVLTHGFKPILDSPPIPFESIKEAKMYIEKMNLSKDQESFLEISALAYNPPPGHPRPDTLIFDSQKEINNY